MKWKRWHIGIFFLLFLQFKAQAIEAFIQPVIFYTPQLKPYVELRIFIHEKGFTKIPLQDSLFTYRAVITLLLKHGNEIYKAEKISLGSPPDSMPRPLLHQLRWLLDVNDYELETKIEDEQNPVNELTLINKFSVVAAGTPSLSELQLSSLLKPSVDSSQVLFKYGFYSEPLIYHQYLQGQNILYCYFETYATQDLGKSYLLKFNLSKKDSSGNYIQKETWYRKRNTSVIDPYVLKHDISALTTGMYKLEIRILKNISEELAVNSAEFHRENPFWDKIDEWARTRKEEKHFFDTLAETTVDYSIRSLYPLISSLDVPVINELFREKKMEEKRIFLFAYWTEHADVILQDARTAFQNHLQLAKYVDALFYSGFGFGFETDRGFIYLKYGKPDEVIAEDKDNGAFPYEIWKYNKIIQTGQTNVKFLFYNPDLAGSDFRLLHSTAHGERHNKRWEIELYKNAAHEIKGDNYLEAEEMLPNFNRRAREYFQY